jgi:hypothetical protein
MRWPARSAKSAHASRQPARTPENSSAARARAPAEGPRNVLCMKWGDRYPSDYVNRLHAMVQANLSGSYRFVCLTDDPRGVNGAIECRPIPPTPPEPTRQERGWRKLTTFDWPLHDLEGTALFLDLDVVIIRPIDALFEVEGTFLIAHDRRLSSRGISNSSVYRFELGAHRALIDEYRADPAAVARAFRNEQAFLSARMSAAGLLTEWPPGWCVSFKYDCLPPWPLNYLRSAHCPPEARIIFFHGRPKPHEAIEGFGNLRRFTRPTPWLADYWC